MNTTQVKEAFEQYVSAYDLSDAKIYLKYDHTKKVAENSRAIARSLNLPQEDEDLAWEIGMLHDIGRFEQLRRYNTFIDSNSIDHAVFGADLLFKDNLICSFDCNTSNYELIEKAIRYHSCYILPADLTNRELLFCQIIRDADKIDIHRVNYTTEIVVI